MLQKYNLQDNSWLLLIYDIKCKWAKCYMKNAFTLGIRSTQLSESLNGDLKDYLKCDLNTFEFFKQFDRVVKQKRDKELEAEFKSRQNVPLLDYSENPLLQQASQRYTPTIFKLFQIELHHALGVMFKTKDEYVIPYQYVFCMHSSKEKEFTVICDPINETITCNCRKFESMEILCSHALKVFIRLDAMDIPNSYMFDRWTRGVKSALFFTKERVDMEQDVNEWVRRIQS